MTRNKKIDQINHEVASQARERTITDGLSEIYQDDNGDAVDVKKLAIKPRRGWRRRLAVAGCFILAAFALAGGVWYFLRHNTDAEAVKLSIEAPANLVVGQEFKYVVKYQNLQAVALHKAVVKVDYPANFIFISSEPAAASANKEWSVGDISAGGSGQVVISGKIINEVGKSNIATAQLFYEPENFSSEFSKQASWDAPISGSGMTINLIHDNSALVGEKQRMVLRYRLEDSGSLKHFWLKITPSKVSDLEFITEEMSPGVSSAQPWQWEVQTIDKTQREVGISFKYIDKTSEKSSFHIELADTDGISTSTKQYVFYQEDVDMEVVKNDLNLSLVQNGSDKGGGVDFGQTLRYTLSYANKGQKILTNVILMATVNGEIDWSSESDQAGAKKQGSSLIWTADEMPELASLAPGAIGMIDFSVKVKEAKAVKSDAVSSITSFAQFSADSMVVKIDPHAAEPMAESTSQLSNKSNTITNKINSDLKLEDGLVYFNSDNLPLGSGPLPFTAGQKTVVQGTWRIKNSLHDLSQVQVSVKLPEFVSWVKGVAPALGQFNYDETGRILTWQIGGLLASAGSVEADFDLAVTPTNKQKRQLLIILPKTQLTATDNITNEVLHREGRIKTSKLEDDASVTYGNVDINDGLVK